VYSEIGDEEEEKKGPAWGGNDYKKIDAALVE